MTAVDDGPPAAQQAPAEPRGERANTPGPAGLSALESALIQEQRAFTASVVASMARVEAKVDAFVAMVPNVKFVYAVGAVIITSLLSLVGFALVALLQLQGADVGAVAKATRELVPASGSPSPEAPPGPASSGDGK